MKIDGASVLNEGDCVTFGHKAGQTIKPGTRIRQPESEYQFVFEKCHCGMEASNTTDTSVAASSHAGHDADATACMTAVKADVSLPTTIEEHNFTYDTSYVIEICHGVV